MDNRKPLNPEKIEQQWYDFLKYIDEYISEPRKTTLKNFYKKHQERIMFMPASHKRNYHSSFIGGYLYHVLNVIDFSLKQYDLWEYGGAKINFTKEELIFTAINHDLGKMGDENEELYLPQKDEWRKNKLFETYCVNPNVPFMGTPERSLFILQKNNIECTNNEYLSILIHDGLYEEHNKKYFISFQPETTLRTCLPYIIHQADLMASRIEFEEEWFDELNKKTQDKKKKLVSNKNKTLKSIKSSNIHNILKSV
jgi:hypothetical protein